MADTVWSQIGGIFDGFFRSMSLFVVFTVFTSLMSLFLVISFQTPLRLCASVPSGRIFEGGYNTIFSWIYPKCWTEYDEYDDKGFIKPNPKHDLTCRGEVTNW